MVAPNNSENSKRIAKNTLFLYFRTFLIMLISLYTSRVVLNVLGVEDYGIYNVVGGVVAMFTVISGSLSSAISRFITFELGKGDIGRLKRIFSTSINIQLGISLLILVLGEGIGVWFLNYEMNIPAGRMVAANWVLHCSLLSFVINLISIPYNACIIAHERMKAFAYVSVLEAFLKLAIVYMLLVSPFDKLATYAVLLVVVALLIRLTYGIYCKRQFEECTYYFVHDKGIVKEMTGFAVWNFFGNTAYAYFHRRNVGAERAAVVHGYRHFDPCHDACESHTQVFIGNVGFFYGVDDVVNRSIGAVVIGTELQVERGHVAADAYPRRDDGGVAVFGFVIYRCAPVDHVVFSFRER